MAVHRNPASVLRTPTQQPVRVPGRVLMRFGALADDSPETMSVTFTILTPTTARFRGPAGPTSTITVCDGAEGSGNVQACAGGDAVAVRNGAREVVYDAELVLVAGGAPAVIMEVAVEVQQGGVRRFGDALQIAVGSGAAFTVRRPMVSLSLEGAAPAGDASAGTLNLLVIGDAAMVHAIALEAVRRLPTVSADGTAPQGSPAGTEDVVGGRGPTVRKPAAAKQGNARKRGGAS